MKRRITYVVKNPDSFSPEQISIPEKHGGQAFGIRDVHAAKEVRLTAGLRELPRELRDAFKQWHEIHIRWVSPKAYTSTPPFTSRVSPGLHVFFTPFETTPENALCDGLRTIVKEDIKCSTTNESAIKMPMLSERFAMGTTLQYYAYLDSIVNIISTFREKYCMLTDYSYEALADELKTASYVDIDYDTISGAVVLTGGWADAPGKDGWSETIWAYGRDSEVEIGVLSHETNPDPEDIQFGGFLTVLYQDETPKPTRFQTPTRHYPLLQPPSSASAPPQTHPLTYTTTLSHPTGLHPTLILSFPHQHLHPPNPTCKLHTHLTLPSTLFLDKYQFSDALTLRSKNIISLRSISGATDLEAPEWVVSQWGSAALFELAHPPSSSSSSSTSGTNKGDIGEWNISIPLHLRYLPASPATHTSIPLPWPVVFWACRADEGAKMAANPFDRTHLGYEALFGPKTRFMHVEPGVGGAKGGHENKTLVEWINVPVLDTRKSRWVEAGTIGTVVVAFLGLCWVLFGRGVGERGKREKEEGKKKQ